MTLNLKINLGSLKTIQNEPLFYNQIFLDTDKHRLQNKIYFHINNLKQVIKPYHMNKTHFSKYIYPLNINNLDLLINFFHRVFNVFHKERPTATELLSDPIFSLN